MDRLKRIHWKTELIILLFSLLVTLLFMGVLLYYQYTASNVKIAGQSYYLINEEEILNLISDEAFPPSNKGLILPAKNYNHYLFSKIAAKLLPAAVICFVVLTGLSILLWLTLKKIRTNETEELVNKLNTINSNDKGLSADPAFSAAYNGIRQKFTDHLNDYKRLNSYLSHEQKNAIAILRANLELSGNGAYIQSLDHIASSIDDILTLSENADISATEVVDVTLVCAKVCDDYKKIQKNITYDFDETADMEIIARERWIYRAVANLVDNAVKYGNGCPISIKAKAIHNCVIITVHDDGIGIPVEKQDSIFGNRYRINKLNRDGYGIGLSLVAHVCDLCGGYVTVDSSPELGTTFYLSFPQS